MKRSHILSSRGKGEGTTHGWLIADPARTADSVHMQLSSDPCAEDAPIEISIIIPVHNGGKFLRQCLGALSAGRVENTEIIVVDDGSTDDTSKIAEDFPVVLLCNERALGPAAARNLASRVAKGSILVFIDADVVVSPETIKKLANSFRSHPDVTAIFGSYDDAPLCNDLISQYKNLMHYYVHQMSNPDAATFWTGLGAIRKEIFLSIGGFDEQRYRYPSIEDVELGYRLRAAGCKILLDKQLQGKHLKRWTLRSLIEVDVLRRAVPWTQLVLETRNLPKDLNFRTSSRLSSVLIGLLVLAAPLLALTWLQSPGKWDELFAGAWLLLLASVVLLNRKVYGFLRSRKGWRFATAGVALHFAYYLYSGVAFALTWIVYRSRSLLASLEAAPSGVLTVPITASRDISATQQGTMGPPGASRPAEARVSNSGEPGEVVLLPGNREASAPEFRRVPRPVLLAFAPLHKRALGIAVGTVFGIGIFIATVSLVLSYHGGPLGPNLGLLSQFFAGYSVSWRGAFVGALWGGLLGYLAGWSFAFLRNLIMALYFFYIRAELEMKRYRDFLAHI